MDTIEYARQKANVKKFAEADTLLYQYTLKRTNIDALRLRTQVLYWMKAFDRAEDLFEKILVLYPDSQIVRLDYARMLFELKKYRKAERLLLDYLKQDRLNAEANMLLANIELWKGNGRAARIRSARLAEWYPDNRSLQDLANTIFGQTGTVVKAGFVHFSDDQPLKYDAYELEVSSVQSSVFSPSISLRMSNFLVKDTRYPTQWAQAGNTFTLGYSTSVQVAAGIFHYPTPSDAARPVIGESTTTKLTGSVQITQAISPDFYLELGADRRPYQNTVASIDSPFLQTIYKAGLRFNKSERWLGKIGYERQHFSVGERIETAYAWFVAPLLIHKVIDLRAGYSFAYANASQNTYTSVLSLNSIVANYANTSQIVGVYDPYFSPTNQVIHSGLVSLKVSLSRRIELIGRANTGLYASADAPYLFLDKTTGGKLFINKGYVSQPYHPAQYTTELRIKWNRNLNFGADFSYNRLFFYTNYQANFSLKYRF